MLFKIVMILLAILAQITIQEAGNNVHKRIRMDIAHRNLTADLAWKSDATVISPVQSNTKVYAPMFYYGYPEIDLLIYLGDKKYKQTVQLDTMYLTSWVSGPKCTKSNCLLCKGDQQWKCEGSCQRTGRFVVNYPSDGICQEGIVFVNGEFVKDSIQIGDVTVQNFSFIDSRKFQQRAGQLDADFNLAAGLSNDNILNAMKNQSLIGYKSMGVYWSHASKFLTFGGYEDYLINNDWVHYDLIVNQGAWTLGLTDLIVGKKRYKNLPLMDYSKQNYFTFDTSLNGLAMPRKYLHHLRLIFEKHVVVTSKTDFTFYAQCNNVNLFPEVHFQLKGSRRYWKWTYHHYVDWVNRGLNDACVMLFYDSGCSRLYAIGYLFFYQNFFYFDQEKRRVSIATTIYRDESQGWPILLVVQFFCALLFVSFIFYQCYFKQKLNSKNIEQQPFVTKQSTSIFSRFYKNTSQKNIEKA